MPRPPSLPGYRLHKQSGQAYVCLNGRQRLLGPYDSAPSKALYARHIAEWVATRGAAPTEATGGGSAAAGTSEFATVSRGDGRSSVSQIIAAFWAHAGVYYSRPLLDDAGGPLLDEDGMPLRAPTEELDRFRHALRLLNYLYGDSAAVAFGPMSLKALREVMIRPLQWEDPVTGQKRVHKAWCRTHTNHQINRIKHVFKWAVGEELLPGSVYEALRAVAGLRRGRSEARESEPVRPATGAMVEQVLPFLPAPVRALVELEAITGARGGELCQMRGCDIDTSNPACWIFRPASHKTAHHGHDRLVPLGKRCQEIIGPFLKPNPLSHLFSPAEWERQRRARRAEARKTRADLGNAPGTNRSTHPKRTPGDRYDKDAYGRAVARACEAAFPPPADLARGRVRTGKKRSRTETKGEWRSRLGPEKWEDLQRWRKDHRFSPHRLRHTAATRLRKQFGLEAAGVVLGQKTMAATLIYAEQDRELAEKVMGQIG